jgi:hypothetical protein
MSSRLWEISRVPPLLRIDAATQQSDCHQTWTASWRNLEYCKGRSHAAAMILTLVVPGMALIKERTEHRLEAYATLGRRVVIPGTRR